MIIMICLRKLWKIKWTDVFHMFICKQDESQKMVKHMEQKSCKPKSFGAWYHFMIPCLGWALNRQPTGSHGPKKKDKGLSENRPSEHWLCMGLLIIICRPGIAMFFAQERVAGVLQTNQHSMGFLEHDQSLRSKPLRLGWKRNWTCELPSGYLT